MSRPLFTLLGVMATLCAFASPTLAASSELSMRGSRTLSSSLLWSGKWRQGSSDRKCPKVCGIKKHKFTVEPECVDSSGETLGTACDPKRKALYEKVVTCEKTIDCSKAYSQVKHLMFLSYNVPLIDIKCEGVWCTNLYFSQPRGSSTAKYLTTHVMFNEDDMGHFDYYWTDYFSEEGEHEGRNKMQCTDGYAVNRIECEGWHCDNKKLQCAKISENAEMHSDDTYDTKWISEEPGNGNHAKCNEGSRQDYYVTGMSCRGPFCDDVKLHCTKILPKPKVQSTLAEWKLVQSYANMENVEFEIEVGVNTENGNEKSTTQSYENSFEASIEGGFEFKAITGGVSTTYSHSASRELSNTVSEVFSQSFTEKLKGECYAPDKMYQMAVEEGYKNIARKHLVSVWQFQVGGTTLVGGSINMKSKDYYCTPGIQPKCIPSECMGSFCQKCRT